MQQNANQGSRLLFVGLQYLQYTAAIIDEMQRAGYAVTFIDIQPRTLVFKIFRTLSARLYAAYVNRKHKRAILQASAQRFDRVFFLQTHQMSLDNLQLLRDTQKDATFTLYNWDSLSNHDYLSRAAFFHRVLTFDREDATRNGFEYLPLFCVRKIQGLRHDRARPRSVFMVGNIVNVDRYHAVQRFAQYCRSKNIEFDSYLVVSLVVYLIMLGRGIVPRGIHFRSISQSTLADMTERALAVFDFANHRQSGYTMRTIENLCAGKKIITNNKHILTDYFHSPDRIHCFADFDFTGVDAFLEVPLADPDRKFEEFYVQNFVQHLLDKKRSAFVASSGKR